METYLAADIGGTQLRAALFPKDGIHPIYQKRIPTQGDGPVLERLFALIAEVMPQDYKTKSIAAAFPGPIDPFAGILLEAPNIPGWDLLPLRKLLVDRFDVPVAVGNDANMAALGEWHYGAGQGHHNLVYLTISTGIGGGVILDDRLLLGQRGLAAELGHVTVLPDGPLCSCGQRGHLEAVGSGTGIANYFNEERSHGRNSILPTHSPVTSRDIARAAEQGDSLAIEALNRAGYYIGLGIANYLMTFNPSIVILGGGVTKAGPLFFEPLKTSMRTHAMRPEYVNELVLTTAALGDNSGLLGTLALARGL
jgi:glucokinase